MDRSNQRKWTIESLQLEHPNNDLLSSKLLRSI